MIEKVKQFAEKQFEESEKFDKTSEEVLYTRGFAFGAVWFVSENSDFETQLELSNWWNNEMREKFAKLALDRR